MDGTFLKRRPTRLLWVSLLGGAASMAMLPAAVWALEAHSGYAGFSVPLWVLGGGFGVLAWGVFWLAGLAMLPLTVVAIFETHAEGRGRASTARRIGAALAWVELCWGIATWAAFIAIFLPAIAAGLGLGHL